MASALCLQVLQADSDLFTKDTEENLREIGETACSEFSIILVVLKKFSISLWFLFSIFISMFVHHCSTVFNPNPPCLRSVFTGPSASHRNVLFTTTS